MFFVHATAMLTLPFVSFFLVREYLSAYTENKKDYSITVWSVVASVLTIISIIVSYIIIAFMDEEITLSDVSPSSLPHPKED